MTPAQREKLRLVVETTLSCAAVWDEDPMPFMSPTTKRLATLSQNSAIQSGFDDRRTRFNAQTNKILNNITGLRTYIISVRLECLTPEPALDLVNELRFKLWDREIQASLHENELAVQKVVSAVKIPKSQIDTRVLSTAVLDLRITAAESCRVASDDIIETVDLTSDVEP